MAWGEKLFESKDENLSIRITEGNSSNTMSYTVHNTDIDKFSIKTGKDGQEVTLGGLGYNSPRIRDIEKSESYELGDIQYKSKNKEAEKPTEKKPGNFLTMAKRVICEKLGLSK